MPNLEGVVTKGPSFWRALLSNSNEAKDITVERNSHNQRFPDEGLIFNEIKAQQNKIGSV